MKNKEDQEWINRWCEQMEMIFSDDGREMQLNLVAQDYEEVLIEKLFPFLDFYNLYILIKDLREEIEKNG